MDKEAKQELRRSVEFLNPFFGPEKFTLESILGKSISNPEFARLFREYQADVGLPRCNTALAAGEQVGQAIIEQYNEGQFEKDPNKDFLYGVGGWYGAYAFHQTRCSITDCSKPPAANGNIPENLRFMFEHDENLARFVIDVAMNHVSKPIAYELNKKFGPSMLGAYARMSPRGAMQFLRRNISIETVPKHYV